MIVKPLRCCVPTSYDAHSRTIVHGSTCTKAAGQPLTDYEFAEWVMSKPKHPAGTRGLEERLRAATPLRTWFAHERDCDCPDCAYVNHHADDNDDRTLEPKL